MTQAVVNWGVLGAAKFAQEHMARAIHAAEGARLVALATSTPEKALPFRAFCPDLKVYDSYDALLADPGIDAVYVPLPNHIHVEWTKQALKAGKHVLTEKPIAMQTEEIDDLIALRDKTGLFAAEAYMIVHHPQWQKVRDLIAVGAIGRLGHVDASFSYDNRAETDNIRNHPETGGGGIRDIGVYTYSSVRFAARAEPVALTSRIRYENGVDTWAQVTGEMAGPGGHFTYSAMTSMRLALRQEVVFHGEAGLIRVPAPFNAGTYGEAQVILRRPDGSEDLWRWPDVNQYVRQVENFCHTVRERAVYPCPLEFSRGTQAMIDMVFENSTEVA